MAAFIPNRMVPPLCSSPGRKCSQATFNIDFATMAQEKFEEFKDAGVRLIKSDASLGA